MVILGIDPGLRFAGYGVIKKDQGKTYILDSGYLTLPPTKSLVERVAQFYDFFEQMVIKWQVTDLAIETPFLGKNSQTFFKLGYFRGVLYL